MKPINRGTASRSPSSVWLRSPASFSSVAGLAVIALLGLAGCGSLSIGLMPRTHVPDEIAAGPGHKLEVIAVGNGVQIYRCDLKAATTDAAVPRGNTPVAASRYEWTFLAPDAVLREPGGRYIGKHYGGPTWEATDGSKVVGTPEARRDAPGNSSIPWLRLDAKSSGTPGVFSGVTKILRVATTGGVAPPIGCNERERGKILRVDYTADYYFYVKR
jgi:hypothetical protein